MACAASRSGLQPLAPEQNHNEIVGWETASPARDSAEVAFLADDAVLIPVSIAYDQLGPIDELVTIPGLDDGERERWRTLYAEAEEAAAAGAAAGGLAAGTVAEESATPKFCFNCGEKVPES